MNYQIFEAQATSYHQSIRRVNARREHWQNVTKPILRRLLEDARKYLKIDGVVNVNEGIHNLESVFLTYNNMPSGLMDGNRSITYFGGYLNFAQTVNGKIMIMIFYPRIEAMTTTMAPKQLEIVEPEEVAESLVVRVLHVFFKELLQWQESYCIQ